MSNLVSFGVTMLLAESSGNLFEQIDLLQILFTIINVCILFFGLRYLLYKPVLKFIAKRKEEVESTKIESEKLSAEVKVAYATVEKMKENSNTELARLKQEAIRYAEGKQAELIDQANVRAKEILQHAERESEVERKKLESEINDYVADISIDIAGKILDKKLNSAEDKKLVDKLISEITK